MAAQWRTDPLFEDVEHSSRLAGLSGTGVYLVSRDGQHWFVRKAVTDSAGTARLRCQVAKQRAFRDCKHGLHTPRILDEGMRGDRYYVDMEFVRGWDAATFLRRADYASVRKFTELLTRYIAAAAQSAPLIETNDDFFLSLYRKLANVQRVTCGLSSSALSCLFLSIERMVDLRLSATLCHGDLTFDNLLVVPGADGPKLWALDLLDAPYEHYWNDLAKLHQDLAGGWYLRSQAPIPRCVTEYVSRKILKCASDIDPRYERFHDTLVGITFARILPYATSDMQRNFVCRRVEHFAARAGAAASTHV